MDPIPNAEKNQSINQISLAPVSLVWPGSMAWHPNQCSTAKLMKQIHNINRSLGMPVSMGERPGQKDMS